MIRIKSLFYKESINESLLWTILVFLKLKFLVSSTKKEIERREKLSIFEYSELAKPLHYYPYHLLYENDLYGNGKIIFKAIKYSYLSKCFTRIEHATPYAPKYLPESHKLDFTKTFITLSGIRKNFLKSKISKKIIAVGPYINYSNNLINTSQKSILKNQLGNTLLVFPSHSIDNVHAVFDSMSFLKFIDSIKDKGFDTIMVSLYWKDIELGRAKIYEERGYRVVTAGHLYDYNFLNRLRSIIELSDYTISNSIGTHVGYSVSLGKPHQIYSSKVKYNLNKDSHIGQKYDKNVFDSKEAIEEIERTFNIYDEKISEAQYKCVKKFWGEFNNEIN
jgi:hypothetical protein